MFSKHPGKKNVLHIGCGMAPVHKLFSGKEWQESRLDIDPHVKPDIVASLIDMHVVESETYDAVFSSHNLEHLNRYEVPQGLAEILRVLKFTGFALITVPDIKAVAKMIVDDKLNDIAYESPAGSVTPLDIIYGYGPMARDNSFMMHKTGFTLKSLGEAILKSGFAWAKIAPDDGFGLWAKAYKNQPSVEITDAPIW